jgi:hypothetical protein
MSYASCKRKMDPKARAAAIAKLTPAARAALAAKMAARRGSGSRPWSMIKQQRPDFPGMSFAGEYQALSGSGEYQALSADFVSLEKGIDIWGKIKKAIPAVAKVAVAAVGVVNKIAKVALPLVSVAAGALGIPPGLTSKVLGGVTKLTDKALALATKGLSAPAAAAVKEMNRLKVAQNNIAVVTQQQTDGKLSPEAAKALINKNIAIANDAQETIKKVSAAKKTAAAAAKQLQLYQLM